MALESSEYFEFGRERKLSWYQEPWSLSDEIYEEAVRRLFQVSSDDVESVYRRLENAGANPLELIEADQETFWSALNELDGRRWHERGVDALTQFYLPNLDKSEYDFIIRETEYFFNEENTDYGIPRKYSGSTHVLPEEQERLEQCEGFWNLVRYFFSEPVRLEQEIEEVETQEDWI